MMTTVHLERGVTSLPAEFRNTLRQRREVLGWSQQDLAVRMGLQQSVISAWERGTQNPTIRNAGVWAHTLGLSFVVGLQERQES